MKNFLKHGTETDKIDIDTIKMHCFYAENPEIFTKLIKKNLNILTFSFKLNGKHELANLTLSMKDFTSP